MSIEGIGKQDRASNLTSGTRDQVSNKGSQLEFLKNLDSAANTVDQGRNTKIMDALAKTGNK